jgi:hypothetical protein
MYHVNIKYLYIPFKKLLKSSIIALLFMSIILAAIILYSTQATSSRPVLQTRVEEIIYDTNGIAKFTYTVNGIHYTCHDSQHYANHHSLEQLVVEYKPDNPAWCLVIPAVGSVAAHSDRYINDLHSRMWLIFPLLLFFLLAPLALPFISIRRQLKKIRYLEQHGELIRGLSFTTTMTTMPHSGRRRPFPAVEISAYHTFSNGIVRHFTGDPRIDIDYVKQSSTVDMLIDPNDPNNYHLDFNIESSTPAPSP